MSNQSKLSFSTIGRDFSIQISLDKLSGRDKHNLFRQLLEEGKGLEIDSEEFHGHIIDILNTLWNSP